MTDLPLILYVPGLLPKPEARQHRDALFRCLIAGIRRQDEKLALDIAANPHCFDIVAWTCNFYGSNRDMALDAAAIDAVVRQGVATSRDVADATSLRRRLARRIFLLADVLPFLIPHVASERMQLHLRDLQRYLRNDNEIAERTREMLKLPLRAASQAGRPILLVAHSMGSVIAYDSLWQLSQDTGAETAIDLFLTMGSPLGQRYMQRRLMSRGAQGAKKFPAGVRRWINLSAVGDLTALDPTLANDFNEMRQLGLVESIEDHFVWNFFRLGGELNVHAEYGYLVNEVTAGIVSDWWRATTARRSAG